MPRRLGFHRLGRKTHVADRMSCVFVTIALPLKLRLLCFKFSFLVSASRVVAPEIETVLAFGESRVARTHVLCPCHELMPLNLKLILLKEHHQLHFLMCNVVVVPLLVVTISNQRI